MAGKKGGQMDTRLALVDAALGLMGERGFESTSVDAIVAKAGLSKGTFFHFFPTKDAILDATCERLAQDGWDAVRPALEAPGTPLERLSRYLAEGRRFRVAHTSQVGVLWQTLAREPHSRLRAKVGERYRALVKPALTQLLAEGAAGGGFDVEAPETTAELLLEFVDASAEGTMRLLRTDPSPEAAQRAGRRVDATLTAIERILGLGAGALGRIGEQALQAFQTQPEPGGKP